MALLDAHQTAAAVKPAWEAWDWFSVVANSASLASLLVSIYAAIQITRVKGQIVGRVRLPEQIAALEANAQQLSDALADVAGNRERIRVLLATCSANLRTVKRNARRARARVGPLLRNIEASKSSAITEQQAWIIYADLNGLIQELKHVRAEQVIGGL